MKKFLARFHEDERGLEALQVVMIIAIAALILAFVKTFWGDVKTWFKQLSDPIIQWLN
jgi:Flp pilus assembly pilin Flp